ncbi:hypothetical protein KI387_015835, partial [Taxus chinensis]
MKQSEPQLELSEPKNGHESKEFNAFSLENVDNVMSVVYKMASPTSKQLLRKFRIAIINTFCPDDQPISKKFLIFVQTLFPVLEWGRHYAWNKFNGDLLAGLTNATLCIPQGIGYAHLALVKPQYALCTTWNLQ